MNPVSVSGPGHPGGGQMPGFDASVWRRDRPRSAIAYLALGAALVLTQPTSAATPYDDAVLAQDRGQWQLAFSQFQALAQQGDARSQFRLSLLYASGRGTAVNPALSVGWLRKSAAQGFVDAQTNLGSYYARGKFLAPHAVKAYAWFTIAAQNGSAEARTNLQVITPRMGPHEVEAARTLAKTCMTNGYQACL